MKNRTKFLLKCLEICSDPIPFENKLGVFEDLSYFCNAAAVLGYDKKSDCEKTEYLDSVELFNNLFKEDARYYICHGEINQSKTGDFYESELEDYLSKKGYFGYSFKPKRQEHRLLAIAFAAAVSETED